MLDQAILEFIKNRQKERITVTEKKVPRKAALLFKKLYPNVQHEFRASRGWFRRMCRRNNLVHRRVTSVGQKVPKHVVEIAEQFLEGMKTLTKFQILQKWIKICATLIFLDLHLLTKKGYTQLKLRPQVRSVFISP